ncbi:uncharacterized protein FA14DRAFT_161993 [Meira miltonrushii]|uniref:Uncharacterized protein n=1 Tax=Meira miltonrushii TaxID=1280837 RepID=A0A316V507_9BASI|nr:uncharacterized protein FA14DRAFT_161993 [Meira miltonrushii]PWN32647.1 hypothetical protein FA14DRAFT_161993 [Meira miltonrushii]
MSSQAEEKGQQGIHAETTSLPTAPPPINAEIIQGREAAKEDPNLNPSQPEVPTDEQKAQAKENALLDSDDEDQPIDHGLKPWSEDPRARIPVLHGLRNEEIWQFVRRFNKQVYHLKTIPDNEVPQGGIDLNIADKDEFTPDKLRSTLERIYMTIGLSLAGFVKHIARVRSWKETKRTAAFFVGFLIVWILNIVMPALFAFIAILLGSPKARSFMFPHAPLAAISAKTGEAKVPTAGHLGSDSLTGAAESYKGEAVEQEASNVVGSVAHLAVSTAIGNDSTKVQNHDVPDDDDESDQDDGQEKTGIDPGATVTLSGKKAQIKASGGKQADAKQEDASADPVKQSIWVTTQPILHGLEDAADTWERFGNALAPTYPFPQHGPRLRIASIFAPLALLTYFVSVNMVYRSSTLLMGLAFFGQPVFDLMKVSDLKQWLDKNIPDWPRYLELRNSILKGVPTNAQITITLLRIGEANKSPVPPPPPAVVAPPPSAKEGKEIDKALPEEYKEDIEKHRQELETEDSTTKGVDDSDQKPTKRGSKILALFKGGVRAGAETALGTNRVKAEVGFERAKQKVGVVNKEPDVLGDGPASFHGRHHGKRGLVLVSTTATTPCVSFERVWPAHAKAAHAAYIKAKEVQDKKASKGEGETTTNNEEGEDEPNALKLLRDAAEKARPAPLFSVQVEDIVSLKKIGGLGWKGKLVVGWAMDSQVTDGLEIQDKKGKTFIVTALPRRDELFNRLASMGKDHKWEAW